MAHSEPIQSVQLPDLPPELNDANKDTSFTGGDLLAEAARRIMAKHTRKLYHHLPGVLSGDDPHDVHQARVATRRLRACMEATAPAFRARPVEELRGGLRRLARALGEVRDRDVLLMRLERDAEQYPESERLPLLEVVSRIARERAVAHRALLAELGRKRTARLLHALNDFLVCPLETVQPRGELPLLVRHYAGSALLRRYEEVRQFELLIDGATSEQLHDLRIRCKHLRYTLELFEPALPDTVHAVTKLVTDMQEYLGNLHDTDVALAYLGVDVTEPAPDDDEMTLPAASQNGATPHPASADDVANEPLDVLQAYIRQRREQRAQLIDGVPALWNRLTNLTNRRKLAGAIAAL